MVYRAFNWLVAHNETAHCTAYIFIEQQQIMQLPIHCSAVKYTKNAYNFMPYIVHCSDESPGQNLAKDTVC